MSPKHDYISCRFMPLWRVKKLLSISAPTAYRWDKKVLEEQLPELDLDDLRILLANEKSIRKLWNYTYGAWARNHWTDAYKREKEP